MLKVLFFLISFIVICGSSLAYDFLDYERSHDEQKGSLAGSKAYISLGLSDRIGVCTTEGNSTSLDVFNWGLIQENQFFCFDVSDILKDWFGKPLTEDGNLYFLVIPEGAERCTYRKFGPSGTIAKFDTVCIQEDREVPQNKVEEMEICERRNKGSVLCYDGGNKLKMKLANKLYQEDSASLTDAFEVDSPCYMQTHSVTGSIERMNVVCVRERATKANPVTDLLNIVSDYLCSRSSSIF